MADLLVLAGYLGALAAFIWLLTVAFRVSFVWGVVCLFLSPLALVFVFTHWSRATALWD